MQLAGRDQPKSPKDYRDLPNPTEAFGFDYWYAAGGADKLMQAIKFIEEDQKATLEYLKNKKNNKENPPV